jgi:GntR family transcriptional regulator
MQKPHSAIVFRDDRTDCADSSGVRADSETLKAMPMRSEEPAYKRIQAAIRRRIDAGQLKPGNPVPSERELARIHRVSLMTARHALSEMARDGIVERRHGAGTFVAPPKVHFNKLLGYTEQMASLGLTAHSRIVSSAIVNREHEIAARLGLQPTSRLGRLERVRLAGDEPVALEVCYWPADEFPVLMEAPLDRVSLFAVIEHECGVEMAYADEEIDATDADQRIADLLSIPKGAPLLRMRQVIFSTSGRATVYVTGFYRSGRHTLRIRRFR